jgi:hypothetical protein
MRVSQALEMAVKPTKKFPRMAVVFCLVENVAANRRCPNRFTGFSFLLSYPPIKKAKLPHPRQLGSFKKVKRLSPILPPMGHVFLVLYGDVGLDKDWGKSDSFPSRQSAAFPQALLYTLHICKKHAEARRYGRFHYLQDFQ